MRLREDSESYCTVWLGILLLSAYFFHFLYLEINNSGYFLSRFTYLIWLLVFPLVLIFTLGGYLRPERSKAKPTMLAISVVLVAMMFIISSLMPTLSGAATFADALFVTSWGSGASLLTSAGFSMTASLEDSSTRGMLKVEELTYPPESVES